MSFLPLFRQAATSALGRRRAEKALRELTTLAPAALAEEIQFICHQIAQKIEVTHDPAIDVALTKLFLDISKLSLSQQEHAGLVANIHTVLAKNGEAKRQGLKQLLENEEMQRLFAILTNTMNTPRSTMQADLEDITNKNTDQFQEIFHRVSDQQAYTPEALVASGLVQVFCELFDTIEIIEGRKAFFASGAPRAASPNFVPMP